ncbi:MAG: arginine repressor [Eubacteriales bacterium]|nr:arginine repressor [Eubacteriales bacterium]
MKASRQITILEIINSKSVETQEDLADELRRHGYQATQATVSRDIKELRLVKVLGSNGAYRYATADKNDNGLNERLIRMFSDTVLSMTSAYNQIILRTISASANIAAETIDSLQWPEILGTIAGDNTILMIVRSIEEVKPVMERLNAMMHRA